MRVSDHSRLHPEELASYVALHIKTQQELKARTRTRTRTRTHTRTHTDPHAHSSESTPANAFIHEHVDAQRRSAGAVVIDRVFERKSVLEGFMYNLTDCTTQQLGHALVSLYNRGGVETFMRVMAM
ncbi:hypothetical protein SARC_16041, partial [Sphaeroforma arctica JP610]